MNLGTLLKKLFMAFVKSRSCCDMSAQLNPSRGGLKEPHKK